jgi:mono/diheme cytochrome c family protein
VQAATHATKGSSVAAPPRAKSLPLGLACGLAWAALPLLGGCNQGAPAFTEPMTLGGREVAPEVLNQGRDLYIRHCVSCHGDAGAGDGPAARSLKFAPPDLRKGEFSFVTEGELPTHEGLIQHIQAGVPERGMPSWKGMRSEDLSALADYIKSFSPRWAPPSAEAAS